MSAGELQNLDKNIQRLKEQLAGKRDILVTIGPEEQVRIKQQIEDLRRLIRDFEREKWDLVASESQESSFPDAEVMVAEIVTELTAITKEPPPELASAQILELLNQIPNLIYLDEYISLVKEKFLRRLLIKFGYKAINSSYVTNLSVETILTNLENEFLNLTNETRTQKIFTGVQLLNEIFSELKEKLIILKREKTDKCLFCNNL